MVHEHKFITYHKKYKKSYLLRIDAKDTKPYKALIKKRFENLEDAIKERDNFLNKYKDKRYKGVTYFNDREKWLSYISIKGKQIHLGTHETQEDAKEYRNEILRKLMN